MIAPHELKNKTFARVVRGYNPVEVDQYFDFLIENEKELVVQYQDKNGVISVLQYGIDYSINEIGNKNGSYIEFPLSSSAYDVLQPEEQISLSLSLQIKQESEFHNSSYFDLGVLEWTFDYIVRILQILNRKIERCVKVEESVSISPDEIINELNNKYEKVTLSHSQIVEISKIIEENKNISLEQTNKNVKYVEEAKLHAEKATQKAKEAGLIIGENISILCDNSYVPECCLPCDGAEYTKAQFNDLWVNYIETNYLNTCTYVEYETELVTYGQCSKFAVDVDNEKFRVPLIKDTETVVTNNIDYENGLEVVSPTVNSPFVVPYDGVYVCSLGANNVTSYLYINGVQSSYTYIDVDQVVLYPTFTIPLNKGDVIYWSVALTNKQSMFYPYKEETKEKSKSFVVVANGQVNQSMMDWSAWASSLQGRLDTDINNITNLGKSNITDLLSPDYSSGVEKVWGQTYTAEVSGWLYYAIRFATTASSSIDAYTCLWIDEIPVGGAGGQKGNASSTNSGLVKIAKGSTYRTANPDGTGYSAQCIRFYPDKGAN